MATREHGLNTQKWQQLEFPTLQTSPSKHGWSKGTNLGFIAKVLICLFSNHKSMECLQTSLWLAHQPLHQSLPMIRLLNVSMSRHRMNYVINSCCRLSRRCTILATSLTMLAMMRIEILKSNERVHRYRRTSRSFYINPPAHYHTTHVSVSLLLQRFLYC